MLVDILVFLIFAVGFSCMWSRSTIFLPVRTLVSKIPYIRKPLLCPECSSFWIAFGLSFLWNPLANADVGLLSLVVISNTTLGVLAHLAANILYNHEIIQ